MVCPEGATWTKGPVDARTSGCRAKGGTTDGTIPGRPVKRARETSGGTNGDTTAAAAAVVVAVAAVGKEAKASQHLDSAKLAKGPVSAHSSSSSECFLCNAGGNGNGNPHMVHSQRSCVMRKCRPC